MISVYQLKSRFQGLLRPITVFLARKGVTANTVTIAALLLSVGAGFSVFLWGRNHWVLLAIPAVLFIRMALNAIDGMLAREHDMKTDFGAILNELADVISDAALYLSLGSLPEFRWNLVVGVVLLAILSEYTGVVAVLIEAPRDYSGPMGKSDRALAFGLLCLLIGLGGSYGDWVNWFLALIGFLLLLTIGNRVRSSLNKPL